MAAERVELKDIARRLLESQRVEAVIGYTRGPDAITAVPCFARTPQEADALMFDASCEYNLANYLHRFKGRKVAIVVKGCDERSVIGLIQEKQAARENLVIIGAPCTGIVDPRLLLREDRGAAVTGAVWDGDTLNVTLRSGRKVSARKPDVVYDPCRRCAVHNPRFTDYVIGETVPQPAVPDFSPEMEHLSEASLNRRWASFRGEMSKCILCFACRNLCPACYCKTCFADSSQPRWMSKTDDVSDAMFFHLTRMVHLTGRCTGCGACERACPMNVKLHLLNDRLRRDVKEVFDFEAGKDPAVEPPMACFKTDDKNDFIM